MRRTQTGAFRSVILSSAFLVVLVAVAAAPAHGQEPPVVSVTAQPQRGCPGGPDRRPECAQEVTAEVRVSPDAPGDPVVVLDPRPIGRSTFRKRMRPSSGPCPQGRRCFEDLFVYVDEFFAPGTWPLTVVATDSRGREGRGTVLVVLGEPRDSDADGLPDEWERTYHLNERSADGLDGAAGDPDRDGVPNLQEYKTRTNPTARYARYFVEGSHGDRQPISVLFSVFDPAGLEPKLTAVRMLAFGDDGRRSEYFRPVGKYYTERFAPLAGRDHPADRVTLVVIESMMPLVVERSTYSGLYGTLPVGLLADTTHGVQGRSAAWYFADGCTTNGMDMFLLFFNPTDREVTATIDYVDDSGRRLSWATRALAPGVRTTVWVNRDDPEVAGRRFSVAVRATDGVFVERAYRDRSPGRTVPHDSVSRGAAEPSTVWHFADVDARASFSTQLVAWNPSSRDADVVLTGRNARGELVTSRDTIRAGGRREWSTRDLPLGGELTASVTLQTMNAVPIVAERVTAGTTSRGAWRRAALGATASGTDWAFAASQTVPSPCHTEFILTNVSAVPASITVDSLGGYFLGPSTFRVEVAAQSVVRLPVVEGLVAPTSFITSESVRLTSTAVAGSGGAAQLIVERTTYCPADGVERARATSLVGNLLR